MVGDSDKKNVRREFCVNDRIRKTTHMNPSSIWPERRPTQRILADLQDSRLDLLAKVLPQARFLRFVIRDRLLQFGCRLRPK